MSLPDRLIDEAMDLTDEQRAELAVLLIDSLDAPDPHRELSNDEFVAELTRRAAAFENGEIQAVPWESVKANLEAKLR